MSKLDFKNLTEGISDRNVGVESERLLQKWNRTGLLEGLKDTRNNRAKSTMARLMENQAAHMLKESSETADVKGFQNIAFPIVRRVFGGLIANELVSVQPMSLPSRIVVLS